VLLLAVDDIVIVWYVNSLMAGKGSEEKTRQVYASIREDLYLAAKARAAELRIPLKQLVEMALELTLQGDEQRPDASQAPAIWDDEYLRMQVQQPIGSPVELTQEEAERVVKATFDSGHGVAQKETSQDSPKEPGGTDI
jgi:hypothetical protein